MRSRLTFTLAFLLSTLLITSFARGATAAPVPGASVAPGSTAGRAVPRSVAPGSTAARAVSRSADSRVADADSAARSSGDVCSLSGLVPVHGSHCPASGRFRRQFLHLPSIPNPLHIVKKVVGGAASTAIKTVALVAILGWVASGAESALKETAKVIDDTTSPELTSSWFSASYWRVAGIAALLTIPFLCAAAIHAIVRADLGLLTRAAFGYLPLSLLAVGIASQLTMLLLAGTDEMSSIVASASLHADGVFLSTTSVKAIAESVASGDPFVTFLAAIITVAATLALWLELLVRNAAVYVIVLMLPLFFAAMVWPARRILAIRAIETLIALILSKFAIVAVLSLGGSALGHSAIPSAASVLTGGTLVLLAAFTPWALLRMLPMHELASAAAGGLTQAPRQSLSTAARTAMNLSDGAVALGAGEAGRAALPEGEPHISGGSRTPRHSAGDAGAGRGAEPNSAEPVAPIDADLATSITGAMSGSSGAGDHSEPGTAPSSAPDHPVGAEMAVSDTDGNVTGSAGGHAGTGARSMRWPDPLAYPGAAVGDDPELPLGNDMLELADERAPRAGAADDGEDSISTRGAGAPAPTLEPPMLPARDAISSPGVDPQETTARSHSEEPPTPEVAPPPELGLGPFGEGEA